MSTWLNRWDIDEIVHDMRSEPILLSGAQFLMTYRDLVDQHSDGWSSWGYGTRCAGDLSQLLQDGHTQRFTSSPVSTVTKAQILKACKKIVTFMKTNKYWQSINVAIPELPVFPS